MNHLLRGPILLFALLCMTIAASAQTETTIYTFTNGSDGSGPDGGLVSDGHGNFFGTTGETQTTWGTVFELSPASGGGWNLATLYTFQGGSDGASPTAALARDAAGNLYGETVFGGDPRSLYCNGGCGTVFELSPNGSGGWRKTTLYQFHGNQPGNHIFDGAYPQGGLTFDSVGNLYGTTSDGNGFCPFSDFGCGAVFELSPNGAGGWVETILHRFVLSDGGLPEGGVIFDSAGNLYGTTFQGGPSNSSCYYGCGNVFKLAPRTGGGWGLTILHFFSGSDGANPTAGVTFDDKGNLYGTTYAGGADNFGVLFKLKPARGGWKESMLHQFHGVPDGYAPNGGVAFDPSGNIYGTTSLGGETCALFPQGCGTVFKSSLSAGTWVTTILYRFSDAADGAVPVGTIAFDNLGNLYGSANQGGSLNFGTIFEITP